MDEHVIFLYTWLLSRIHNPKVRTIDGAAVRLNDDDKTIENALVMLDDLTEIATGTDTQQWAQRVASFIRRYKV